MKRALTAAEIADLGLPGLPGTKFGVQKALAREGWPAAERLGRGGGLVYPIIGWPGAVTAALEAAIARGEPRVLAVLGMTAQAQAEEPRAAAPEEPAVGPAAAGTSQFPVPAVGGQPPVATAAAKPPAPSGTSLATSDQRRVRDARATLLGEIDRRVLDGDTVTAAVAGLVEAARAGTLAPALAALVGVANARGGEKRTLSVRTVMGWRAALAKGGADALVPAVPQADFSAPAWAPAFLALWRSPTKRSLADVLEHLELPAGVEAPSIGQVRRFLDKLPVIEHERGRRTGNALLALKKFRRRDTSTLEPLDVVTADGHTFKGRVRHPVHGQPFQPEVMAIEDMATRYVFGWSAGIAESRWVVMDALRHGISSLGMFAVFYTDNGPGFSNGCLDDEVIGMIGRLGGVHTNSIPGRPQGRGAIERLQASLWIRAAKRLPSYCGKDMDRDAGKKIARRIELDQRETGDSRYLIRWPAFLDWCREAISDYNARPHRALPKVEDTATGAERHMTPAEALAGWRARGWTPLTIGAEEQVDLFRPYEERVVQRAEVKLPWGRYYSGLLDGHHGETVHVGYDIHDGARVWVRATDGRLLAIAERDGNVVPYMPATKIEHARDVRARAQIKRRQDDIDRIEIERLEGRGDAAAEAGSDPTPAQHEAAERIVALLEAPVPAGRPALALVSSQPAPAPVVGVAAEPTPVPSSAPDTGTAAIAGLAVSAEPGEPLVRPHFTSEFAWARWVMANPTHAEESDHKLLKTRLAQPAFRLALGLDDADLCALG